MDTLEMRRQDHSLHMMTFEVSLHFWMKMDSNTVDKQTDMVFATKGIGWH